MVLSAVLEHNTEGTTNHTLAAPSAASCGAKDEEVSRGPYKRAHECIALWMKSRPGGVHVEAQQPADYLGERGLVLQTASAPIGGAVRTDDVNRCGGPRRCCAGMVVFTSSNIKTPDS